MKKLQIRGVEIGHGIPKIAVPVSGKSVGEIIEKTKKAAAEGAEIIELRADCLQNPNPESAVGLLGAVRETAADTPLLFTFRTTAEGGAGEVSSEAYASVIKAAVGSGSADLVDIEAERPFAEELAYMAAEGGTCPVLSNHDFKRTPDTAEIIRRLRKMEDMGAGIAKCAYMPGRETDVTHVLAAAALAEDELQIPAVTISMGRQGQITRVSGEIYGCPFTFGCLKGDGSAPGQLETAELRDELQRIHDLRSEGGFLFLTGFMGTGKTTVSRILSAKTGIPAIEMDAEISRKDGRTIPEIFSTDGEEYFRDLETRELEELCMRPRAIVSCGGGCVLRPENRAIMKRLGTTVLLTAKPETVLLRLSGRASGRPKLKGRMTPEGIGSLMAEREEFYVSAADHILATDELGSRGVAETIRREYL